MPVSTSNHYPIRTMNRSHFAFTRHAPRAQGFSLVEMAMVLLVVGLLAALFLPATNTMMDNNRRKETRTKLEVLETAITRFVMTNRRLPCPADGSLAPGDANQGLEQATCAVTVNGVLPWKTLAITQSDAVDAWGNLVTYRVWGAVNSLTQAGGMDMSTLNPATAGAVSGWLVPRGFRVCNSAPTCLVNNELSNKADGNGVAYFLISHGGNKIGGYTPNGVLVDTATGYGPGTRETHNGDRVISHDFYVDVDFNEDPADYFDDIVLRPTVMKVALDAGLGPRAP